MVSCNNFWLGHLFPFSSWQKSLFQWYQDSLYTGKAKTSFQAFKICAFLCWNISWFTRACNKVTTGADTKDNIRSRILKSAISLRRCSFQQIIQTHTTLLQGYNHTHHQVPISNPQIHPIRRVLVQPQPESEQMWHSKPSPLQLLKLTEHGCHWGLYINGFYLLTAQCSWGSKVPTQVKLWRICGLQNWTFTRTGTELEHKPVF